jgi:hypothetical protein
MGEPKRAAPRPVDAAPKPTAAPVLTVRNLKVTVVLQPGEVAAFPEPPPGTPRVTLQMCVSDGRIVTTDIAAKSLRKVKATIAEYGVDAVAVVVQGKLAAGGVIAEAGLVVQPKVPKPPG